MSNQTLVWRSIAAVLLALPLAGCYISSTKNIAGDFGERIDLASKLWCTGTESGEVVQYAVNELRSLTVPNKFKYTLTGSDGSGLELVFRDLEKPAAYLVQAEFTNDAQAGMYYSK